MADGGAGDIIIKGGSVHVEFDPGIYKNDANVDPTIHKHTERKITRVLVKDDKGDPRYDSGTDGGGLQWMITVSTSDK
jgi:hypothetical protein